MTSFRAPSRPLPSIAQDQGVSASDSRSNKVSVNGHGLVKSRSTARMRPPEVQHIGNYRLIKTIGKGNFAKVKLAKHVPTGKHVAIKIIDKSMLSSSSLQKMFREVRIMKALDHPNIVKLFEVLDTDRCLYLMMEYAAGGELFDYLAANGRMKERDARATFRQIVSAVQYCHQKNIVHRDLKAENLLLDKEMNVKIADFGFSNEFDHDGKLDTFCGSPPYAAPELFQGKKYTGPEVDIWSLGVILYTLSSGSLPFDGQNLKELRERVIKGKYRVPFYMSTDCENLLKKFLVINPLKRTSLENAMRDKWLNITYEGNELQPYQEPEQELDEKRIETMLSMGHTRREIEESLNMHLYDEVAATYLLLGQKQIQSLESAAPRSWSSFSINNGASSQSAENRSRPSPSSGQGQGSIRAPASSHVVRPLPTHAESVNYHQTRPVVTTRRTRSPVHQPTGSTNGERSHLQDSNDRLISERSPISVDFDKMSIIAHGRYSDQSNQSGGGFVVDRPSLKPSKPAVNPVSRTPSYRSTSVTPYDGDQRLPPQQYTNHRTNTFDASIPPPPESFADESPMHSNSRQTPRERLTPDFDRRAASSVAGGAMTPGTTTPSSASGQRPLVSRKPSSRKQLMLSEQPAVSDAERMQHARQAANAMFSVLPEMTSVSGSGEMAPPWTVRTTVSRIHPDDNNIYGPPSAAVGTTRFGRNVPGRSTVHGGTVQDHAATAARNLPVEPPRAAPLGRHSKMSFLDKLASRFKR